jgi:ABC-2 type transport system permease protein
MIGKIIPYVLIGLVQVSIILALGMLLFGVPMRGSLLSTSISPRWCSSPPT